MQSEERAGIGSLNERREAPFGVVKDRGGRSAAADWNPPDRAAGRRQ